MPCRFCQLTYEVVGLTTSVDLLYWSFESVSDRLSSCDGGAYRRYVGNDG
jgi:hypothetical protein